MKLSRIFAAAAAVCCIAPAGALNIVLVDSSGSFATAPNGAEALFAFQKAANYWNTVLTNDVTVRFQISFDALGPGVLGSTGSSSQIVSVSDAYARLAATGTTALDAIAAANMTALTPDGGLARVRINAEVAPGVGVDPNVTRTLTNSTKDIANYLDVNQALIRATGMTSLSGPLSAYDASITFSSNFAFDFTPNNGIDVGKYDFTAVAVHELGHALGFVSGTDVLDVVAHGAGPLSDAFEAGDFGTTDITDFALGSTLDLFRYGNTINPDGRLQLQWSANRPAMFSIDGKTMFSVNDSSWQEPASFSTGAYSGDGEQASHWKDNVAFIDPDTGGACLQSGRQVGVMDPTSAPCHTENVTRNDLAAFDAMGWNTNVDVLTDKGYKITTAEIFLMDGVAVAVPEPATYAQLALGLGLFSLLLRARRRREDQA